MKTTKTNQVLEHLQTKRTLTTWAAIKLYGATRLAAIVFNLKNKGHVIHSINMSEEGSNGNMVNFTKYIYAGFSEPSQDSEASVKKITSKNVSKDEFTKQELQNIALMCRQQNGIERNDVLLGTTPLSSVDFFNLEQKALNKL